MQQNLLQQVQEVKLLGGIVRDYLAFNSNTENITRNAYKRMRILHNLNQFSVPHDDKINIYVLYIGLFWRSQLLCGTPP